MKMLLKTGHSLRVIADSAVGRNNQPWFIPDFGENWRWSTAVAFRIGKLGKGVSPRFAGRYIDAVTLLWVPEADNCAAGDYMDSAVVCGNWLPIEEVPADAAGFLTEISASATVKTGDVLAIMNSDKPTAINLNDHISLQLGEAEVLSFNIK